MTLEKFLELCQDDNDVYIYDEDGDYLDCGLGCHTKYFPYEINEIWLNVNHICVQIDY